MKSQTDRIAELEEAVIHLVDGISSIQDTVKNSTKQQTYDKIEDLLYKNEKVAETVESAYE
jgi:hypothetical protein